ncbi:MAG TPA: iron-containing redox enzyme family protein [Pseudobdellovibrionaceae bacterium]|jgi:hypothetical protein
MKKRIESAISEVGATLVSMDFSNQRLYEQWLAQAYFFVKHSTPMLALSAGLSVDDRNYHIRCIDHLSEEKGHDKMLLNDLKFLGRSIDEFQEMASTQALYQTQYYWIEHKSPKSFLGYIFLLEGLAVHIGKAMLDQVSGFKGNSFLRNHAEDDVDHLEKAFLMFDQLTLSEQQAVADNCDLAAAMYISMLQEIKSSLALKKPPLQQSSQTHYTGELLT